jgi:hypothetical protein
VLLLIHLGCTSPDDTADSQPTGETEETADTDVDEPSCGLATFSGPDGDVDLTDVLLTGEVVILDQPGALHFCKGDWFAQLVVRADLTLTGEGTHNTVVSGGESHIILLVEDADLVIRDVTLDRGAAREEEGDRGSGGGIRCQLGGSLNIERVHFTNNTGYDGAGLYARDGCTATVRDSVFLNNTSKDDGGAFRVNNGEATIRGTLFEGNKARDGGALIFHETPVLIEDSTFRDNESTDTQGGAVLHYFAPLTVRNSVFEGNRSLQFGGAMSLFGDTVLEGVRFEGNESDAGGAVVLYPEYTLSCSDCSFEQNLPDDVQLYEGDAYSFGEGESFTCSTDCE